MRRLLRALFVVLVLLALLGAGLTIAARVYLRSDRVRRQVAARLEELYGGRVEVEETDIGLLGDSSLHGLRLHESNRSDEEPWVRVGTVKTDVSALDLLRGVMPRQITLTDPAVTLRLDRAGHLLTQLPETPAAEGPVPEIRIEGGRVTLRQEGRPEMVVNGIRAEVQPDGDRLTLKGEISDPEWGDWSLDGAADRAAGSLTFTLKTDRAEVTQDKLLRLPEVPPGVWKEVEAQGVTPVEFTFRHDPRTKAVNHYRVVLNPSGAAITLPVLSLRPKSVRGGITIEDNVVTLDKVRGQDLGGELEVDGTLDFRGRENVLHFVVTAKELDVRQVPEQWNLDERLKKLGGKLSGKADLTVRYDGDVHTSGEGHGELTGVMLGGKATTIELDLHPTRKGFRLHQRPAQEGRLPKEEEPSLRRTDFQSVPETNGRIENPSYVLTSLPVEDDPLVREATRTVHDGVRAVGRTILDTGTKAVGRLPRGDITKPSTTPPTYLDLSLNLKDVDLARLLKDLEIQVPFEVSGRLSMKVQASIPVDRPHDLKLYKVSGSATLPIFTLSGVEMKDVTARVRYEDGILRLEEVRGRLVSGPVPRGEKPYAGTFAGSARLGVVPEGDLTAELKLTEIPLSQLAQALGIKEEVTGAVSGSAELRVPSGKLRDPSAWQGSGQLSSPRVTAYGWTLTDAAAGVRVGNGLLSVRDVTGKLEGATVSGSAEAKLTAPYTYEGHLELARGDLCSLQRLAPGLRPPLAVAGTFGVTAEVRGTLKPFTAKVSGSATGQDVKLENAKVKSLSCRWEPAGDVLKVSDVKARLYGGEVTGSADVPLAPDREGKLDLRLQDVDVGALVQDLPAVPLRLEGNVNGSLKGTLPAAREGGERSFDGEVELTSPKLRVQNLPAEKITGTLSYRKGVGEYHLKGGLLGGTFDLDGRIPPRKAGAAPPKPEPGERPPLPDDPPPPADSHLRIRGADLGRLGQALEMRGVLDALHGRVDVDVDFRLDPTSYLPIGSGGFRVTRLRWGDEEIADTLQGTILLADGELRLSDVSGELGGGSVRGQVRLSLRDPSRGSFRLNLDRVPVERLLVPWPTLAANVRGSLDARLRGSLGRVWRGGGDLTLTQGRVFGVEVSEWHVPLRFELAPGRGRGEINSEELSAQVAHGRVNGRFAFRFGDETRLDGNMRFFGVELRELLRSLNETTSFGAGRMSGRIDFASNNVRSLNDVTANVEASFSQTQGYQLPILAQILPFISRSGSNTTFQSGELRGRLADGIFRVQRLTLSGNLVNLIAEGTVTTTGRLNLDVTAATSVLKVGNGLLRGIGLHVSSGPLPIALLAEITNRLAGTSLHLIVSGTLRDPVVRVEPLSLLTDEAARFFLLRARGTSP
jgi:hypothetical protein